MRREKKLDFNNTVAALKYSSSLLYCCIICEYRKARYTEKIDIIVLR